MKLENTKRIIKDLDLNCTAQEFIDYYNSIDLSDVENKLKKLQPTIATFDQHYSGPNGDVKIENPANGKYYYYLTIGGRTFLQNIIPYVQGLQPLTDKNIDQVIVDHKTQLIQDYINGEKLRLTIENFKQ